MYKNTLTIEADLNRHFSRYDDALWDTDLESSKKSIRVSVVRKNDGFTINVLENEEAIYCIDSVKLTKKQSAFLQTGEGLQFILNQYKQGIRNISSLKKAINESL
jgi:hypothetical protein